ncbi:MAG TPA: hypothetical protein VH300_09310 [Thermoleophilaceae bacterium]|nr:hypothetical protein [Thermoleophilaceae bacterium]
MRTRSTFAALAALLMAAPPAATADSPPPRRVAIIAVFNPITYGDVTFINGRLVGTGQAGQQVVLEQSAPPFTDWVPAFQTTADSSGYYSFEVMPGDTTQFRATAQGTPSQPVQISVTPKITLTAHPAGASGVRFSWTLRPGRPAGLVTIQRRSSTGAWANIGSAGLGTGSLFGGRLRAHYKLTLRAIYPGDDLHRTGISKTVTVTPRMKRKPARHVRR